MLCFYPPTCCILEPSSTPNGSVHLISDVHLKRFTLAFCPPKTHHLQPFRILHRRSRTRTTDPEPHNARRRKARHGVERVAELAPQHLANIAWARSHGRSAWRPHPPRMALRSLDPIRPPPFCLHHCQAWMPKGWFWRVFDVLFFRGRGPIWDFAPLARCELLLAARQPRTSGPGMCEGPTE